MKLVSYLLVNSIAVLIASYLLSGIRVDSIVTVLLLVIVLGVINTFIRPIVLLLTLPINVITLGLFTFVINAVIVLLAGWLVQGFTVSNFWWALLFSLVVSLVSAFLNLLTKE